MKRRQKGFTLVELMFVVAMTVILAAIAIPQYQDYITRAKWQDNISQVQSYKTAIAECLQHSNGDILSCDTSAKVTSVTGATAPTPVGNLATLTQTATTGALVLTGTATVGSCVVCITPTATATSVTWAVTTHKSTTCGKSKTGTPYDDVSPATCSAESPATPNQTANSDCYDRNIKESQSRGATVTAAQESQIREYCASPQAQTLYNPSDK